MEIYKIINGYHIYIGGTWCEVTKNGEHIYDGSVEEGITAEEVYKQITKEEIEIMNKLEFLTNNNGTMCLSQNKIDGDITVHTFHDFSDFLETKDDITISKGDMVMLINFYHYVKENDIQNDFINPYGENKES